MASPNPFTPLGEDEISNPSEISNPREDADAAAPPPGYTDPRAPTHGWDSFVHSLDETAQRELGVVDDILISYANFAGEEFRMFDIESARMMDRIIAMEDALEFNHDEVVQTKGSLSDLKEIVLANATGISNITNLMKENATTMRENISNVAALRDMVDATSAQVTTMAAALRDVTETANTAFRLASGAQPTIDGHGVRLNALVDDVSKMSSNIDGLCASTDHTTQLTQLEGTVSRIDSEFVALRTLLERQTGSNVLGDSRKMPHTDTSLRWMTYILCFLMSIRHIGLLVRPRQQTALTPQRTRLSLTTSMLRTGIVLVVFHHPDRQPRDLGHRTWTQGVRHFSRFHLLGRRTRQLPMPHLRALGIYGTIWMIPAAWVPWTTTRNMMTMMHPWGG